MSTLEVLNYLTDPTFTTVLLLVFGTFGALQLIHKIGGAK